MAMTKEKTKTGNKVETAVILGLALLACGGIGYCDGYASVPYLWKALGKMLLFVGIPLIYWKMYPHFTYQTLFRLKKEPLFLAGILGASVLFLILGVYFLLGGFLDLSAVTGQLEERMKITKENFVAVAVYIALCNSFLEEFFFRGFLYFRLKALTSPVFAHLASATVFSLYHVAIMVTWFEWWLFALCLFALVVGGVLFNLLDDKEESLYPSWLTHACANVALNTIGMILFYG